jgi:hypothetical protein
MTEVDPQDPRVVNALAQFHRYVAKYHGYPFNKTVLKKIEDAYYHVVDEFKKLYDLDFPPVAPLILPTSQVIVFYRRDLTDEEIQSKILFLLRDLANANKEVSVPELAKAMLFVWPSHRPPIEDMEKITKVKMIH